MKTKSLFGFLMGILVIFFHFEISGIHLEEIQIQIGGKCESINIHCYEFS